MWIYVHILGFDVLLHGCVAFHGCINVLANRLAYPYILHINHKLEVFAKWVYLYGRKGYAENSYSFFNILRWMFNMLNGAVLSYVQHTLNYVGEMKKNI